MKRILVVVDMQNDFIDGTLGTAEAVGIVDKVVEKIHSYSGSGDCVYATRDTHEENYLETSEGRYLPVKHCIKGTNGWEIRKEVADALQERKAVIIDKPTFGSEELSQKLWEESRKEEVEIELVGLCTDICVVTNALLLKTKLPETKISVDSFCCAGVSTESHAAALQTMKMCQIEIGTNCEKD
jgi:nicotinamidase-related amidase